MGIRMTELELENFANLYTGLGIHYLHLDFSNQKFVLCVIIGKNGRGKTSLLSYMTPFAGLGDVDVRDSSKLIISKEKGYKRIVFLSDNGDVFEIKHYYTPSYNSKKDDTTYTVKSYIALNGVELNENGNVTSFKSLVCDLMGVEMDYLKLIRIGDNVKGLIDSKDTERKVFMGKILSDVYDYLREYKKMVAKSLNNKAIISHITDSLKKTAITDLEVASNMLSEYDSKISRIQSDIESEKDKLSRLTYEVELIGFNSEKENELYQSEAKLKKYEKFISKGLPSADDIRKAIETTTSEIITTESEKAVADAQIKILLDELDRTHANIDSLRIEYDKEERNLDLDTTRDYVKKLRLEMNSSHETRFDEISIDAPLEAVSRFMSFLKWIQMQLNTVYEWGKDPIAEVLDLKESKKDVEGYVRSCLINLDATFRADKMSVLDRLIDRYSGETYNCTDMSCPFRLLHSDLLDIRDTVPVTEINKDESFYMAMKAVNDALIPILSEIRANKGLIKLMPEELQDIFDTHTMFGHIKKVEPIYSEDVVNRWLNLAADKAHYDELVKKYENAEKSLKELESRPVLSQISKQVAGFEDQLKDQSNRLEDFAGKLNECVERLERLTSRKQELLEQLEAVEDYESVKKTKEALEEMSTRSKKIKESVNKIDSSITMLKFTLDKEIMDRDFLAHNIEDYKQLSEDLEKHTYTMDLDEDIKYALSNRTGLPLFNMDLYLRDTVDIANSLLDIVYDGRIYLDAFDISEDRFRMPYIVDGTTIPDVSCASQGEKSFFNMAISSALRAQCMETYNIGLFDEVDGCFDDDNRQKTIPVMEKQLEISNIRQAFLITHNLMFSKYPTDVIDLDNLDNSTIKVSYS